MGTVYIYALCDPDTEEVRYIGATKHIIQRVYEHLYHARIPITRNEKWLATLTREPVVLILEETDEKHRREVEQRWIAKYIADGARLVNDETRIKVVQGLTQRLVIKQV